MSLWYLRRDGVAKRKLIEAETAEEAIQACGDEEDVILAGHEVWDALFELGREPGNWEAVDEETGEIVLADGAGADRYFHGVIDDAFGAICRRFITTVDGMDGVYALQAAEATLILGGAPGPFPMLQAIATIANVELLVVATVVNEKATFWISIAAPCNAIRLAAKEGVSGADTEGGKAAIAAATLATFDEIVAGGGDGDGDGQEE